MHQPYIRQQGYQLIDRAAHMLRGIADELDTLAASFDRHNDCWTLYVGAGFEEHLIIGETHDECIEGLWDSALRITEMADHERRMRVARNKAAGFACVQRAKL